MVPGGSGPRESVHGRSVHGIVFLLVGNTSGNHPAKESRMTAQQINQLILLITKAHVNYELSYAQYRELLTALGVKDGELGLVAPHEAPVGG